MTKLQTPEKSHPLFPSNPLSKLRSSEASFRKFGRKLNPSSPILQQKGPRGGGGAAHYVIVYLCYQWKYFYVALLQTLCKYLPTEWVFLYMEIEAVAQT